MKWLLLIPFLLFGQFDARLDTLYNSLDPASLSQLFAFYKLYPETPYGAKAKNAVWALIQKHRPYDKQLPDAFTLPELDITALTRIVNRQAAEEPPLLSGEQLSALDRLCTHLKNRNLRGYRLWTRKETETLASEEIDLARALLLYQYDDAPQKVRQYEATLDIMALQILARLAPTATEEDKVNAISNYIFHEMRYRFPPHSLYAKEIDLYTFLPSVIDSRKGVCLGVSILYLTLAQRLGVSLDIITPPGHIFVRYKERNIETTARGIHLPDEQYLSITTRSLWRRSIKEVVGMAFFNQASIAWQTGEHKAATALYEKALPFMPDDPLLKTFLGYNYLLTGQEMKGRALLTEIAGKTTPDTIYRETLPEDYLAGHIDAEGIALAYKPVDDNRESIIKKQNVLQEKLRTYPKFRGGLFHLAITYLQLGRSGEALEILQKYHALEPNDPTAEYYLAILSLERFRYRDAWTHLAAAQAITAKCDHHPKALKHLRQQLRQTYPME